MKISFKDVLPEYPSTRHLPWKPNSKGDKIANELEASVIHDEDHVYVQEKCDGANCGMSYLEKHPVVRSRTKILRKGQQLKNPSLAQFASAWNWMHQNKKKFLSLMDHGPYSVYGEWMIQQHGMSYDSLPDWFIAYDIYDWEESKYIDPEKADVFLAECGFARLPIIHKGKVDYQTLETLANEKSLFDSQQQREGVIVKVSDGEFITTKFKMVRQGFEQGCLLGDTIARNKLA